MFFTVSVLGAAQSQTIAPTPGMVIDHSVTVTPGTYRLTSASLDAPAITVRGAGITIDLTGVTIEGGEAFADPDGYTGNGILIDGVADVTIKGGAVRGYKVGIRAQKTPKLHITGADVSYNWKPRLWSGIEHESLLDWMSYHQNEKDEWLRYGAGIYLTDCDDCEIDNSRGVQGSNGLMITRANRARIWNNTFSWNSALGIGMYRVTDSYVGHNRVDWDVRGYSDGFYYRGQDSAAILMYEQSSRNNVSHNSATHGGDGLFLWAGQSTMDTGQGGANDNRFFDNDFSHAVANGIEATFSRNRFISNRIDDCWHGVWGGYSYDSEWLGNSFANNTEHIAIEHGQNNKIIGNRFTGGDIGIRLWANATQDPSWGYAKNRDTKSHGYVIEGNKFDGVKSELQLLRTSGVAMPEPQQPFGLAGSEIDIAGAMNAKLPDGARQGRSTIIVDEWGPYDYLSPKLWPAFAEASAGKPAVAEGPASKPATVQASAGKPGKLAGRPLKLRVLGPEGKWTLKSIRGGTANVTSGVIPAWTPKTSAGEIIVTPTGSGADLEVTLEYVGGEVVSPRGKHTPAGQPYQFSYRLFDPVAHWNVRAWAYDDKSDPITAPAAFAARLKTPPSKTFSPARLDYISGGVVIDGLPRDQFALVADGTVNLPAGDYALDVISDDGIKVWLDGKLVIDKWSVHESELDQVKLARGKHRITVQYFEQTGWAELQVRFRRD
jgi:nitrous oxidase accessory protein NosD